MTTFITLLGMAALLALAALRAKPEPKKVRVTARR